MDPILVQVGPIAIRWYGALIALGVFAGGAWTLREARRRGFDPEPMLDMAPLPVLGGLLGAEAGGAVRGYLGRALELTGGAPVAGS